MRNSFLPHPRHPVPRSTPSSNAREGPAPPLPPLPEVASTSTSSSSRQLSSFFSSLSSLFTSPSVVASTAASLPTPPPPPHTQHILKGMKTPKKKNCGTMKIPPLKDQSMLALPLHLLLHRLYPPK